MHRSEAAYVKCVKSFFGFKRRYSVAQMFCDRVRAQPETT